MMWRALSVALTMLAAVALSWMLTPREDVVKAGEVRFADIIPKEFGDWREVPSLLTQVDVAVRRDGTPDKAFVYDEVLSRTYRNSAGEVVMLSIAYGRRQRQEEKIHRPELCYAAQGFTVKAIPWPSTATRMELAQLSANALLADVPGRIEPVIYWVRVGGTHSQSALRTRLYILKEGLRGRVVDGVLVRTSQVIVARSSMEESLSVQQDFISALIQSLEPADARRLVAS